MDEKSGYVDHINSYVKTGGNVVGRSKTTTKDDATLLHHGRRPPGLGPPLDRPRPQPPASPKRTASVEVSPGGPRDRRPGRPLAGPVSTHAGAAGDRLEVLDP